MVSSPCGQHYQGPFFSPPSFSFSLNLSLSRLLSQTSFGVSPHPVLISLTYSPTSTDKASRICLWLLGIAQGSNTRIQQTNTQTYRSEIFFSFFFLSFLVLSPIFENLTPTGVGDSEKCCSPLTPHKLYGLSG